MMSNAERLSNRKKMCLENVQDCKKRALAALSNARFWERSYQEAENELNGISQGELRFAGPNSGRQYEIP